MPKIGYQGVSGLFCLFAPVISVLNWNTGGERQEEKKWVFFKPSTLNLKALKGIRASLAADFTQAMAGDACNPQTVIPILRMGK